MDKTYLLIINGKQRKVTALETDRLLDVLREHLRLTGTKEGCGEGECGACTVILNGELVNSCLVLFGQLENGDQITTIEGVAGRKKLAPLQEHFLEHGGTQCGICTPGMILAAHALLAINPRPTREEIARAIAGNLCRCTGYKKIIDAIEECSLNNDK
jgi:carbon-monoxide dehydrogenase small subunit